MGETVRPKFDRRPIGHVEFVGRLAESPAAVSSPGGPAFHTPTRRLRWDGPRRQIRSLHRSFRHPRPAEREGVALPVDVEAVPGEIRGDVGSSDQPEVASVAAGRGTPVRR